MKMRAVIITNNVFDPRRIKIYRVQNHQVGYVYQQELSKQNKSTINQNKTRY